jgi:acyl transferase domain-containing protein
VLKRLEHAIEDGDHVLAVLDGSAVTNDGGVKAGYTAPTAAGQSRAIVAAQQAAGVSARDISYVECHATAVSQLKSSFQIAARRHIN